VNFFKGKISDFQKSHKGYFAGSFFSPGSLQHDSNFEIAYKAVEPGFTWPKHRHGKMKTYVLVLSGKMYFKIDGEDVSISAGEFVVFPAKVSEEITKVEPNTVHLAIHTPSVPGGDKEMLD